MRLLFSDTFNRPNTVSGLGPNWQNTRGNGGRIVDERVSWSPGVMHGARVHPDVVAFPADQWAELTIVGSGQQYAGVGVRVQEGPGVGGFDEQRGYFFWFNSNKRIVAWHRVGSSGEIALATAGGAEFAANDVIYLEAVDEYVGGVFVGVRLRARENGVTVLTVLDTFAGAWRSGQPGYNNYYEASGRGFDNFRAGDFYKATSQTQFLSTNF